MLPLSLALIAAIGLSNLGAVAWSLVIARRGEKGRDLRALRERLPLVSANALALVVLSVASVQLFPTVFDPTWPGLPMVLGQLALVALADDAAFYWLHRWMHENRALYNAVHRLHHRAVRPLPCDYLYAHPLEWGSVALFGPVAAFGVLYLLTGVVSGPVLVLFQLFRTGHEVLIHSGAPTRVLGQVPLLAPNEHHALHHASPSGGNYASTFRFWDTLGKTVAARAARGTMGGHG